MQTAPLPPAPRSRQLAEAQAAAAAGLPAQLPPPRPAPMTPTAVNGGGGAGELASESQFPNTPTAFGAGAPHDAAKYKTKLCRNFMLGHGCSFEDRCVFAHGEDQLGAPPPPPRSSSFHRYGHGGYGSMHSMFDYSGPQHSSSGIYDPDMGSGLHDPSTPVNGYFPTGEGGMPVPGYGNEEEEASYTAGSGAPMPPSYEAFVHTAGSGSPSDSPPAPTRYRHDPYNFEGYVVKYL